MKITKTLEPETMPDLVKESMSLDITKSIVERDEAYEESCDDFEFDKD